MIEQFFSSDGALAKSISGFQPRQPQIDMAKAVFEAIHEQQQLVVEAGTGTGKTFAYLAPALLSGKKCIVSTGSKNLQEQLYHRDLPLMISILGFTGRIALLKGRNNYLCLERLSRQMMESHQTEAQSTLLAQLVRVRQWSSMTKTGDLGECEAISEDNPVWAEVTSTNESCLGRDCPAFDECFVFKARRKAMEAELVIVNHHLFLADLALKETGYGELIPQADVFIFDEAHQIPDIASQYFGQRLSSRQLLDLSRDIEMGYLTEARDMRQLQKIADKLRQTVQDTRIVLGSLTYRGNWREAIKHPDIQRELTRMKDALSFTYDVLKLTLGRSQLLDAAFERTAAIQEQFKKMMNTTVTGYSYWYECTSHHFVWHITPLSVAEKFREQINTHAGSWIFTSATLAVDHDFGYFCNRLGLEPSRQFALESPFDYQKQALLCVPRGLPESHSPQFAEQLVRQLSPIIEHNQGRCFFLCTSHQMVKALTAGFRETLTLPVLMQGDTNKQALLAEYLSLGNALLIATGAFWEGVDVRGQVLSCVIIDKLPFTAPDDPLLKARMEDCVLRGGDAFEQVQIPDAVITLKQGVGRLIRDQSDKGALIICDNRLVTRGYGAVFLRSLPALPRTRDITLVKEFLSAVNGMTELDETNNQHQRLE